GNVRPRRKGTTTSAGYDDRLHGSAKPDFAADVAQAVIHFEGKRVVRGGTIEGNKPYPVPYLVEEILLEPILHVSLLLCCLAATADAPCATLPCGAAGLAAPCLGDLGKIVHRHLHPAWPVR